MDMSFAGTLGIAKRVGMGVVARRKDPSYNLDDWLQDAWMVHAKAVESYDGRQAFSSWYWGALVLAGYTTVRASSRTVAFSQLQRSGTTDTKVDFAAPKPKEQPFDVVKLEERAGGLTRTFIEGFFNPSGLLAKRLMETEATGPALVYKAAKWMGLPVRSIRKIRKELREALTAIAEESAMSLTAKRMATQKD